MAIADDFEIEVHEIKIKLPIKRLSSDELKLLSTNELEEYYKEFIKGWVKAFGGKNNPIID